MASCLRAERLENASSEACNPTPTPIHRQSVKGKDSIQCNIDDAASVKACTGSKDPNGADDSGNFGLNVVSVTNVKD